MLRMALNVSWRQMIQNAVQYNDLPAVSQKIRSHRMKLAGHCVRHGDEMASKVVLWEPNRGQRIQGDSAQHYIDVLLKDTVLHYVNELHTAMNNREEWKL